MTGTMGIYKCACCGGDFPARTADRARGWARYCSKRCKAIHQSRGYRAQPVARPLPRLNVQVDDGAAEAMARREFPHLFP